MQFHQHLKLFTPLLKKKPDIHIGNNTWQETNKIIANLSKNNWLFLTDETIFSACAEELYNELKNINPKSKLAKCKPHSKITEDLIAWLNNEITHNKIDLIISCGSGIISDLSKVASAENNIEYIIFASAPSMNGYLSSTATVFIEGKHQSLLCKPPIISVFDLKILSNSPLRLIRSGAADSLCFHNVHLDWLASYLIIKDKSYIAWLANILLEYTDNLYDLSEKLEQKDSEAIRVLTEHLIISGLAMQILNSSIPASQGEHLIAHYYNSHAKKDSNHLHGEDIALTSNYMDELQEKILSKKLLKLNHEKVAKFQNYNSYNKFSKKSFESLENACKEWETICKILKKHSRKPKKHCNLKINYQINSSNWQEDLFLTSTQNCFKTRDRFTFLDLEYFTY